MNDYKISGIYCITNIINNKKYIGSAKVIIRRWYEHKKYLRNGNHKNKHLQSSWNFYGEESFKFEILENVSFDLLITKEQYWLDEIIKNYEVYNVNLNVSGFHNRTHSEETRKKISYTKKSQNLKTFHSEETRKKISQALKGVVREPLSAEHKQKISLNNKRVPMSEETKQKVREQNSKEFRLIDPEGNLHCGVNLAEFCRINNLDRKALSSVVAGSRRQHKKWTSADFIHDLEDSKKYVDFQIIGPDGILYTGRNLSKFCKEHNLRYNSLQRVLKGQRNIYLGWKRPNV